MLWMIDNTEKENQFSSCSWCNKKNIIITCANCGCGVKYGDTYPRKKDKMRICENCYKEENKNV